MSVVTQELIDQYKEDGVVCLRQVVDEDWLGRLQDAAEKIIADPAGSGGELGPSQGDEMVSVSFMWRNPGVIRDYVLNSTVGEIVGEVIGAEEVMIFHDHLFVKPAMSPKVMPWHLDATVWPVKGEMAPNIWLALSPVNTENGRIEFLAGYHKYCVDNDVEYGFSPDQSDGLCPDFEAERDNSKFPYRYVSWDLEPGDAVIFHPATPHFSKGNDSSDMPRIGLALRMFGNDTVWHTKPPYKMQIPGIDYQKIHEGDSVEHELLPVIWKRSEPNSSRTLS